MHLKCHACAQKVRTVDASPANLYAFAEITIGCMTQAIGYRNESDYRDLYSHAVAHYTLNPDEVSQYIFQNPDGKYLINIERREEKAISLQF